MSRIEYDTHYHIYNRGNNKSDIFTEKKDYFHFLGLIQKYLLLVADIYCYALMKNHFHLLVRIKAQNEINFLKRYSHPSSKWKISTGEKIDKRMLKKPVPYRQFSHLFNSYAKWFNHNYSRTGSLFEKNFEKKEIDNEDYMKHMVYYIHHNPIHHGFADNYTDYPWTSYTLYTEKKPTFLDKETVIGWFADLENFIFFHQQEHDLSLGDDFD